MGPSERKATPCLIGAACDDMWKSTAMSVADLFVQLFEVCADMGTAQDLDSSSTKPRTIACTHVRPGDLPIREPKVWD